MAKTAKVYVTLGRNQHGSGCAGLSKQLTPNVTYARRPAVFLDRDGVINENRADYVKSWQEVVILPGAFEAIRRLASSDYVIAVVTNQSPIGRGIITEQTVDGIHARLVMAIEAAGGRVDGAFYCPHHPEEGCDCRKPQPGLLLQAAEELALDLANSWFVGDARSDVEAALNAGCRPIMVRTGRGEVQLPRLTPAQRARTHVVPDLAAAVDLILDGV
jgi:D-glycero-D-manno-heptose 1,7-bisphosphate phosphatase